MEDQMAEMQAQAFAMMALAAMPVAVDAEFVALEGGEDPAFGTVRWRTLFCADKTSTQGMVVGVAEFGPEGTLKPHRHEAAEVYFGLSGSGAVTIEGQAHAMAPGTALFIPGDALHDVVAGADGLRFLYMFPRDRFSEIEYRFAAAG